MSRKPEKEPAEDLEDRGGRWLFNLLIWLLVSPSVIVGSITTGYLYGTLFGIALALWRVWATPEITNRISVRFFGSKKQGIDVKDSPGTQALQVQGTGTGFSLSNPLTLLEN